MTFPVLPRKPNDTPAEPTKPIILCDVDGVLADFVGAIVYNIDDPSITPDTFKEIDLAKSLTDEQFDEVESWCHESGFCSSIRWYPAARTFLACLESMGDVWAVTAPWVCETWCSERLEWLEPYLPRDKVIFTKAKYMIRGDVLIEDNPDYLAAWAIRNPDSLAILIDRPWNQTFNAGSAGTIRVGNLVDAVMAIRKRYLFQ